MSSEDLTQNGLRVGGWVPPGPSTRSGVDAGTVYRGGVLAARPADAPPEADDAVDGPSRRSLGLFGGLLAAAALSLTGFVVASNVGTSDRVVGTMGDPAPLLPAPPVLPPFGGASSGAVDRPGKVSDLVGSVAAPTTPYAVRPDALPSAPPVAGAPVVTLPAPSAPPALPAPPVTMPAPTLTPSAAVPTEATVPLSAGSTVSLETPARPGHLVRHESNRAVVDRVGPGSSADERAAARFTVRPGLADSRCVSFESDDRRRHFLRHRDFAVYLHRLERTKLFARDATFCPVPGAANRVSLRSLNYPDRYLSVRDSRLYLEPAGSPEASTFAIRPPV